MGGKSSSDTTQSSSTQPWAAAMPTINGLFGQVNNQLNATGLSGNESNALDTLTANAQQGNPYAGLIGNYATNLLQGGGATDQSGNLNSNYQRYVAQTNPLASNTNYDPYSTPGFKDAINTMTNDITSGVNGSFAAAGRDFSGANQQALSRGLSQGLAPTIASQYNQNVQNQQGAAGNLYNAGNTTSGLLTGLQQQSLANKGAGVTAASTALDAQNYGANQQLAIEAQRRGIPMQALGLLAQIGIPLAALGTNTNGQSHTDNQMSGAQQFATIAGGVGSLGKLFSDKRLKVDIEPVGELFDGQTIYRYRYLDSPIFHIGVIAQDVEKVIPEAVAETHGFKMVDYKIATQNAVRKAA